MFEYLLKVLYKTEYYTILISYFIFKNNNIKNYKPKLIEFYSEYYKIG